MKLYVRDNAVRNLLNIDTAPRLTHLYIINNEITELDTVTKLSNLEKLYAGRNRIQVQFCDAIGLAFDPSSY